MAIFARGRDGIDIFWGMTAMKLSIRNRLAGTVVQVALGEAMGTVRVQLDGVELTAAITADSVRDLGLAEGTAVQALIKSTDVAVATGPVDGFSIRNRLPGTVASISHGAVMSTVKIILAGGGDLTSAITREAVQDLGLTEGSVVTALVKATEVSLALA